MEFAVWHLRHMSELAVGWLLLEQAAIALEKIPEASATDKAFYEGKRYAAVYFAQNVLPFVATKARTIAAADDSAAQISDDSFGRS